MFGCTHQCGKIRKTAGWIAIMEEVSRVRKELARGAGSLIPQVVKTMDNNDHYMNTQPPDTIYVNDMHCDMSLQMLELDMGHRILKGANDMLKNQVAIDAIIDTVNKTSTNTKTGIIAPEAEWYRLVQLIKHERILPQSDVADVDIPPSTRADKQTVYVMGLEEHFMPADKKWLEARGHDIVVLLVPPMTTASGDTDPLKPEVAKKIEVLRKTMVFLDSGYAHVKGTEIIRLNEVGKPKVIILATKAVSVGPTDMTWIDAQKLNFRNMARPGARFEVDLNVSTTAQGHRVPPETYPNVHSVDPEIVHVVPAGTTKHLNANTVRAIGWPGTKQTGCSHVNNTILNALSLSSEGQPLVVSTPTEHFHTITDSVMRWANFHGLLTVFVGIETPEEAFESAWNADIVIVIAQTSSGDTLKRLERGHRIDKVLKLLSNGFIVKQDGRARVREKKTKPMLLVLRDFELHPIAPINHLYYQGHEVAELRISSYMYCMNKIEEDDMECQTANRDLERKHSDDSEGKGDSYYHPNEWFSGSVKIERKDTEASETPVLQFSEPLHVDDMHMRIVNHRFAVP